MSTVGRQRVVKERFEGVVKKVVVSAVITAGKSSQEIVGASAPILAFLDAEPALLLEKVEEHNLAHELLREVHGLDLLLLELVAYGFVFRCQLFQRGVNVLKELPILSEEFLRDGLNAEGIFDTRERRVMFRVLEQIEKAGLRSVAALAFADDVGKPAGGGQS